MSTPHYYRRSAIHSVILLAIITIAAFVVFGCNTQKKAHYQSPCEREYRNKKKFTAWIKRSNSNKVFILGKDGIICSYYESK